MQPCEFFRIAFGRAGNLTELTGDLARMFGNVKAPDTINAGVAGQHVVGEVGVAVAQRRSRAYTGNPNRARMAHYGLSAPLVDRAS